MLQVWLFRGGVFGLNWLGTSIGADTYIYNLEGQLVWFINFMWQIARPLKEIRFLVDFKIYQYKCVLL